MVMSKDLTPSGSVDPKWLRVTPSGSVRTSGLTFLSWRSVGRHEEWTCRSTASRFADLPCEANRW